MNQKKVPPTPSPRHEEPTQGTLPLSRRGFLAVLGGAVAALLQACGLDGPAPTPTETPPASTTLPPTAAPTGTTTLPPTMTSIPPASATSTGGEVMIPLVSAPEATGSPTPPATPTEAIIPTETATPVPPPTATPAPSPTPRPAPTPFPPGPATKLGLFIGYQHPTLEQLLRTGNVPFVKTLEYDPNLMEFIKQISPNTILVARYTPMEQINLASGDPIAKAREFVDFLLPIASESKRLNNIDAWEAYNEPVINSAADMEHLAIFEAERTRLLAAAGIRSCIGNFATGTPPLEFWPQFFPAIEAIQETNGYLGLHEYSAPYMWYGTGTYQANPGQDEGDEGWLTLRYRKVYRQYLQPAGLEVPLLITETGIDGGVRGRPGPEGFGWQDFQGFWEAEGRVGTTPAGFYMEQLAWYDAELQQDSYVLGASIYALAAPIGWGSFEINGQLADLLLQYLSVHPRRG